MMRLPINIKQDKSTCQELKRNSISDKRLQSRIALKIGQEVFLYGDRTYRGKLIHPVEHTYPPRWTVKLDRGGYEAVNVKQIDLIESRNNEHFVKEENNYCESDPKLPFSDRIDEPETSTNAP